jgi:Flp pilus assembly protein TadG
MDRWRTHERGETLVEFALSFTVFLMTVLGTMVLGLAVFRYNMISNLAQEGARRASVCGKNNTVLSSSYCDVDAFVRSRALGIPLNSVTTNPPTYLTTLDAGQPVTVTVQHTFAPMSGILPVGSLTLTSSARMIASH